MKSQILDKNTWISLRPALNGIYNLNDSWNQVINLFKQRIEHFYLNPIEKIIEPEELKGEGFSIVTLQCVLIQMLAAFKYGEIYNRNKPKNGGFTFEYKYSTTCFYKFLHTEAIFRDHFYTIDASGNISVDQPYSAEDFYDCVRCGLMHEARTKNDWRIIANAAKAPIGNTFITTDPDRTKIIHRTKLNTILRSYFEDTYIFSLRQEDQTGESLRRFLARKIDHLHDVQRDSAYEWWSDP